MPLPKNGQLARQFPRVSTMSRVEHIGQIVLSATNTSYNLPTSSGLLPSMYMLSGLILHYRGRVTMPAATGPSATNADAPYSLLENIRVEGFHKIRGRREERLNIRGADLRQRQLVYEGSAPYSSHTAATLSLTADATNDVEFVLRHSFVPPNVPWQQQMKYLLDAPNFDSLKLEIRSGDQASLFTVGVSAATLSAFGSATGSPTLDVYGVYALGGADKFGGFVPGVMNVYGAEVTAGDIVNGSTSEPELFQLSRGYTLRSILLKSGVKASAGSNNAYLTLSDAILSNIKVNFGQRRPVRYWPAMRILKDQTRAVYGLSPDAGYGLIDFATNGTLAEALNTAGMISGPSGNVALTLSANVAAGAGQAAEIVYEELRERATYNGKVL